MRARTPIDTPELREGTVTAVRAQKNDPERVSVYIDDEFAFGLAAEIAIREGLRKGRSLSVEEQAILLAHEQKARARQAALDFIAHRPRTETEVARRLEQRGFDGHLAADMVAWLRELGYLDDEAYARSFVAERASRKGHGPRRLRADLLRRGVAPDIVERAVETSIDHDELRGTAQRLAAERWERLCDEPDPRKRRKRLADFLARRGFGYELIREVVAALERER